MSNIELLNEPTQIQDLLQQPIMKDVEVLVSREGGLYECNVPINLVDHMDVPVDHAKLTSLLEDFNSQRARHGGSGQKTPARIGYVPGELRFRIIDGFHRYTTLRSQGFDEFYSTVEIMPLDELLDERIRNANMHDNIKFARTAEWMGESWGLNPLSERVPITSVFTIAHFDNLKGRKFGLTEGEYENCASWAHTKAKAWETTVSSLYQTLKTAMNVAPELIHNVRPSRAVTSPESISISPSMANALSAKLGKKFDHQRVLAQFIDKKGLSANDVGQIGEEIAEMPILKAREYLASKDWEAMKQRVGVVYRYGEDDFLRTQLIRGSSAVRPLHEVAILTEDALNDADLEKLPQSRLEKLYDDLSETQVRLAGMVALVGAQLDGSTELPTESRDSQSEYDTSDDTTSFMRELGEGLDSGVFPEITSELLLELAQAVLEDESITSTSSPDIIKGLEQKIQNFANRNR